MAPAINTLTGTARMMAFAMMVPLSVSIRTPLPDQSIDVTGVDSRTGSLAA